MDPFFTHTFLVTPVLAILSVVTAGCFVAEAQHSPVLQICANDEPVKVYDEHSLPGVAVDCESKSAANKVFIFKL